MEVLQGFGKTQWETLKTPALLPETKKDISEMSKNLLWFGLLRSDILIEKAMKNTALGAIIAIAYIIVIVWLFMRAEKEFLGTLPGFIIVVVLTGITPFISLLGAFGVFALIALLASASKGQVMSQEEKNKMYKKRQNALYVARGVASDAKVGKTQDERDEIDERMRELESPLHSYEDISDIRQFILDLTDGRFYYFVDE